MAPMNRRLYEALRGISLNGQAAAAVAEALSKNIIDLKRNTYLLRWTVGFNLVLTVGILWMVAQILMRLPA